MLPQKLEDPLPLIPEHIPLRLLTLQLRLLRLRHRCDVDFLQLNESILETSFLREKSFDRGLEVFG